MYKRLVKPFFDITASIIILIISFPVFFALTVLLFFINSGEPFFIQKRPGKNEKIFSMLKFKTMNDKRGNDGLLLPDSERISKLGKFIRATSLDELPQLINVIIGDMSLVGPRPLLVEYLEQYNNHQKKRHLVKPGITGWAQINGRNAITWEQKFEYDVWYVENAHFVLDLKILFLTIKRVLNSEGVNQSVDVPMSKFTGEL